MATLAKAWAECTNNALGAFAQELKSSQIGLTMASRNFWSTTGRRSVATPDLGYAGSEAVA